MGPSDQGGDAVKPLGRQPLTITDTWGETGATPKTMPNFGGVVGITPPPPSGMLGFLATGRRGKIIGVAKHGRRMNAAIPNKAAVAPRRR